MAQTTLNSASALQASQAWLDRISNNLANLETNGYAEQSGSFEDSLTQALGPQATAAGAGPRVTPPGWWGGTGVVSTGATQDFSSMALQSTGIGTDLAISGDGFFSVAMPNGTTALTKAGHFHFNPVSQTQSMLVSTDGYPVLDTNGKPIVANNKDVGNMVVGSNGQIMWGSVQGPRIAISAVPAPNDTLDSIGQTLYAPKQGTAITVSNAAGSINPAGTIVQGSLNGSNVDITTEMTDMIMAQRMFDLNAQALQFSGQMHQIDTTIKP